MARLANVEIPNNKRIVISLTYIFGIGKSRSQKILKEAKVDENIRTKDLTIDQLNAIRKLLTNLKLEGELKRDVAMDIKRLGEIKSYRGIRHRKGLPVRGQVTQKNARTRKGRRKTASKRK